MVTKPLKIRTKICKRCDKTYKTEHRNSRVCPDCDQRIKIFKKNKKEEKND